ncbi:inter-alpha-trypsin inhibitor heavy chain H4 isoform X2 [Lepus europaeus]|uniref:inter-alpha-trypsin inhibitor heavy chain H4 isoform X2 n=1 Tax=Lepus europaeus TaxID=9983 RepID=UPI002B4A9307|nr:inter-alpha-trypsin inhibitor heavy chain H4 isoform X2 [Lepus europaeus]
METPALACTRVLVLGLLSLHAGLAPTVAQKNGIDIYSLTMHSEVSSRFARTVVTSRVVNRAETLQEATFQLELPRKAFLTNFSMTIDGVAYPGKVREKAAAQRQYSAARAKGESASLVKTTGRTTEQFQVSVSVAAASKVTFQLVYEELLQRRLGAYELLLKVQPQQLVQHLQVDVHIFEPQGISFLETESSFMTQELERALTTSQNETKAHIRFKPTLSQQQQAAGQPDTALNGSFIIRYDVNRTLSAGSIQIENGYFVHHFAPEGLPTMPKNVIFVVDQSGSMLGRKIQQTREALIKILDDLNPRDRFNLILFSSSATPWKTSLVQASPETVSKARSYAGGIQALGGTDINEALLLAVSLLDHEQAELPTGSVSLLILLTDGEPTQGETNPTVIQRNVREAIGGRHSLFCLGFGFNVNYPFLEKLALDSGGLARRVYEDSDAALQLQDFYQEVAHPQLTSVAFEYSSNAVEEVTRDNFRLHFLGSEMVVAGKLRAESPDVLSAKVRGRVHKENITFYMESSVAEQEAAFRSRQYIFGSFMERLWAYLTIQQLLEQMVHAPEAQQQALESRARNLSLDYSFVTPLTSMVVTKPEGQRQDQVAEKPSEDDKHKQAYGGGPTFSKFLHKGQKHPIQRMQTGSYEEPSFYRRKLSGQASWPLLSSRFGVDNSPTRFKHPGHLHIPFASLPPHLMNLPTLELLRKLKLRNSAATRIPVMMPPTPSAPSQTVTVPSTPSAPSQTVMVQPMPSAPSQTVTVPPTPSAPNQTALDDVDLGSKEKAVPDSPPAPLQAPSVILPLHGQDVDRLCVDFKNIRGPLNLISDPVQGIEVTGQYEMEKAGFSWIKVTVQKPELQVHATPERVVVTRNRRNSEHKWRKTLFSLLPGLKMTMDDTGLLLIGGLRRVTVGLLPWDGPKMGLLLLLHNTDRFSSSVKGTIGQFYPSVLLRPSPTAADQWILKAQADYLVTREHRLDYQAGPPGREIACWSVEL